MQRDTPDNLDTVLLVYMTCPDETSARHIAETLVADRLAACVNIVPGAQSVYRWQGAIETATESLLTAKTRRGRLEAMQTRVNELHPDELPELIAVEISDGSPRYLDWVVQQTR